MASWLSVGLHGYSHGFKKRLLETDKEKAAGNRKRKGCWKLKQKRLLETEKRKGCWKKEKKRLLETEKEKAAGNEKKGC